MALNLWLTFAAAYLLTTISPGPNVLLVVQNSLKHGSASALVTIAGNLFSQLLIVILVAFGVGTTIAALPQFFFVAKLIGAAYLIFLGAQQVLNARSTHTFVATPENPRRMELSKMKVFRQAFLVSSSNLKTLIFLSAFMPQFVDQHKPLVDQFAVMYITIALTVVLVHLVYSASATRLKQVIRSTQAVKFIKYLGGSFFVLLGVKLLVTE